LKNLILRFALRGLIVAQVVFLTACGGGGGGGGLYSSGTSYLRTEVPYSTPILVGTVDPLVNTKYTAFVGDTYVARTVASYINGMGIIDEDAIFKPIGDLSLSTAGGYKAINGFIASANLGTDRWWP